MLAVAAALGPFEVVGIYAGVRRCDNASVLQSFRCNNRWEWHVDAFLRRAMVERQRDPRDRT
jgi:hypothetical protein